ncbi:MAG: hypothetical protein HYY09_00545, partial [Firmicutes bacterium]|nr:hypothetical protein [Bacillota bacterium]
MEKSAAPGTLGSFAADLHIHVGRALGRPVKITASPALTLEGILEECAYRKGIQAAGLVDALSPPVREELATSIRTGTLRQVDGGGLLYGEAAAPVLLVPAIELELRINDAPAHFLIYLPDLGAVEELAAVLKGRLDHPHLSTRPCRIDPCALASLSGDLGGFLIPAHAFTPHKGVLGAAVDRLSLIFGP